MAESKLMFNPLIILTMKKIVLVSLVMVSSFASANTKSTLDFTKKKLKIEEKPTEVDNRMEKQAKSDGILDTCYGRVCKTVSIEGDNGDSVEIKRCSDWVEVDCPNDQEEEAPMV